MNTEEESLRRQLISAYEIVLQPTSSIKERKDAESFCEKTKASGFMAFKVGFSLLDARNGYPVHLRNLGANFIEHSIRSGQFGIDEALTLRHQFWSLVFLQAGAFDALNEKVLLKEKVASCMAIMACRYWLRPEDDPLHWNDFFEGGLLESVLKAQTSTGAEHLRRQEFALLTISNLINLIRTPVEIGEGAAVPIIESEDRRMQLHSGLEIVLPPFSDWLFNNFPSAAAAAPQDVSSNVLLAAVSCFKALCTWMNNLNIEGVQILLQSCLNLLLLRPNESELSCTILDTLSIYFAQRSFPPAEHQILEHFMTDLFPIVCQLLQKYAAAINSDDPEESYQNLKSLISACLSISNRYICNQKTPLVPKNISDILGLFTSLGQIPSLAIYLDILEFWSNTARCSVLQEKINLTQHLPQLFMLVATRMTKSFGEERKSVCNEIDFEEAEEFKEFWLMARLRSGDLIRLLTSKFPGEFLEYSYNALGSFIQSNSLAAGPWEGLLAIEEFVARACENKNNSDNSGDSVYNNNNLFLQHLHLLTLHSPRPTSEKVLEKWIGCVKAFCALLGDACPLQDFQNVVQILFSLATASKVEHSESIRSTAAFSMLRLADANPRLFIPLLEPLLGAVAPLLTGPSGSWERRLFSELILIFMAQPTLSPEQQMTLFSAVADPLVELLKTAKSALLSEVDPALALMRRVGYSELKSSTPVSEDCRNFTTSLNLLLSTLQILFKRIGPLVDSQPQSPVVQTCLLVLDELVAFLMLMIQCIHRLGIESTWRAFFNNSTEEFVQFYPKIIDYNDRNEKESSADNSPETETSPNTNTSKTLALVHIAGWTRHYRINCYLVLGLAASSFKGHFYALPSLPERFMSQPLSALESLGLSDWNLLLKLLMKPVLMNASEPLIPSLMGGSLSGLLSLLPVKLNHEWALVEAANSSTKPASGAALAAEMSREAKCNTLSAGFIGFLSDLLCVPSLDAMKTVSLQFALENDNFTPKLDNANNNLPATWLFSPSAPEALIFSLTSFVGDAMLRWPRSVGVYARLTNLLIRIIVGAMGRPDFPNRAVFLAQCGNYALSTWASPAWVDHQLAVISLLCEIYKWSFLLLANDTFQGKPILISDPDPGLFLKNFRSNPILSGFETEISHRFGFNQREILALRSQILTSTVPKVQRAALRSLLHTVKVPSNIPSTAENIQKELSSRLQEMKKRISRTTAQIGQEENFDGLLEDLFK